MSRAVTNPFEQLKDDIVKDITINSSSENTAPADFGFYSAGGVISSVGYGQFNITPFSSFTFSAAESGVYLMFGQFNVTPFSSFKFADGVI